MIIMRWRKNEKIKNNGNDTHLYAVNAGIGIAIAIWYGYG